MTSGYVVDSFRSAGLSVADVQPIVGLPTNAVEATQFDIPNVGNGKVITFQTASDATQFAGVMGDAWHFQKGIVLVELSVSVDEATARQYAQVLDGLKF
jgi:hypothetical protein